MAVIGTGASAVQLVPEIAGVAGELTVLQRSAPYVMPKPDRLYSPALVRRYRRIPLLPWLVRQSMWLVLEAFTLAFWKWPGMTRTLESRHAARLAATVTDPRTRAALTPDYRAGCKRILISATYHACFNRDDVAVVTAPITAIDATGVRTAEGHHEVDVILCATGFRTDTFVSSLSVTRPRRHLTARTVARRSAGVPGDLGAAVPQFLSRVRPQHQPRLRLGAVHDRNPGHPHPHGRRPGDRTTRSPQGE